jgi:hypothetical protein
MGNCLTRTKRDGGGLKVDTSQRSFTRRLDPWEKTGMVAFRNSNLREFPAQVEVIAKKVRVLDATGNKIREVPSYISLMVTCNRLGLSKNRISSLPEDMDALVNLRVLLLDNNRFHEVPECIFALVKLERVDLAHNHIHYIPPAIQQLKSLKMLDVSHNKLTSLPKELSGCEALEELHLSSNAVARIPIDIAKLERLRLMVAENNFIDSLPPEILLYCDSLQTLALHGNPLTLEKLQETKGYAQFEARRKAKWDKTLAAGVLLGTSRFSEAADRSTGAPTRSAATATHSSTGGGTVADIAGETSTAESPEKGKKKKNGRRKRESGENAALL